MLEPLTNDSIEPYNGSTEEKYGNEKIENFWEELIPTIDQIKPISFGSQEKNLLNFIKQADNSLFLFSEVIISEYLKDEINYLDQRGVRVYLLLKEIDKNHKHYNKQSNILRELGGKCLIRYTSFYPTYFTIILINTQKLLHLKKGK